MPTGDKNSGDISTIIAARVEGEFDKLKKDALDRFDDKRREVERSINELQYGMEQRLRGVEDGVNDKRRELERFTDDLRHGMEQRLKDVEDRITRDVRTRVFSIALSVVAAAAGTMLLGSFAATRDVNNSVIALQKDMIAAQTTIKTASNELNEHTKKLVEAQAELTKATNASTEARSKLDTTTSQLGKARGEYEGLEKTIRALQQGPRQ